ncbi:MAG: nucleotide pyrophosphohydrolase [Asgard group archaeon]|nr:nucleotide pyrophosphohydrolase [Asgard group archaeon]
MDIEKENQFELLMHKMELFLEERDWKKYHTPKNIAMSIAIESAELMELFQWTNPTTNEVRNDSELLTKINGELADVMIYSISLALSLKIDLFKCILEKMAVNNERFSPKSNPANIKE